jgi:hypothetical protein
MLELHQRAQLAARGVIDPDLRRAARAWT